MPEQYTNFGTQTLITGLAGTSTATTWFVSTSIGYPTSTPFHVTIDTEILVCTASTEAAGTFTMSGSRGQESTTVTTHTSGATVLHALTAGAMNQIRADLVQSGSNTSKVVQLAGNIYLPTDASSIYRDNGSAFSAWGPIWPLGDPNLQTWTAQSMGTGCTTNTANGGISILNTAAEGAINVHALTFPVPATPYHIEFGYFGRKANSTNFMVGACFSDGTKYEIYDPAFQAVWGDHVVFYLSNNTTFSNTPVNNNQGNNLGQVSSPIWVRLGDNGTLKTWDCSVDGYNWTAVGSESSATNFTATKAGIYVDCGPSYVRCISVKVTT